MCEEGSRDGKKNRKFFLFKMFLYFVHLSRGCCFHESRNVPLQNNPFLRHARSPKIGAFGREMRKRDEGLQSLFNFVSSDFPQRVDTLVINTKQRSLSIYFHFNLFICVATIYKVTFV